MVLPAASDCPPPAEQSRILDTWSGQGGGGGACDRAGGAGERDGGVFEGSRKLCSLPVAQGPVLGIAGVEQPGDAAGGRSGDWTVALSFLDWLDLFIFSLGKSCIVFLVMDL